MYPLRIKIDFVFYFPLNFNFFIWNRTRSFTELTDAQWKVLEPLMPPPPPIGKCGRKNTSWRRGLNPIFWVLTTGARWKDVPRVPQWASKSAAHRCLGQ